MQQFKPLVSIIIPTFNRVHLIGESLDSILAQTYEYWECIVVDDGSNDYTQELLSFYCEVDSRIKYIGRPKSLPAGANACRNLGLENSNGVFVKCLDSDDLLTKNYLEKKVKVFKDPSVDLVVCNYLLFRDNGFKSRPFNNSSNSKDLLSDYVSGQININAQSCLWRKKAIKDHQFDPNLKRAQELDFHFRILRDKELEVIFLPENLVFIRDHRESISGEFSRGNLEAIRSDLLVRAKILEYLSGFQGRTVEKERAFNLYLPGIMQLIHFKYFKEIYTQFNSLGKRLELSTSFNLWKIKLVFLLILFKLTGRSYRLRKHISSLKI
ncbi:glycosyltransferase family 2 protein [Gramella lutea]|uniref:Glycosyltransferase family 2 protein n=1 Tax=Christiangramia lutea TaxID=1607951 RepID=A0A9X1V0W0_9FLAO|nr:glycosyltransferase family 2 protein [Christiangramia lutea]MCH4821586.1 glycosyltransferase family 2 protein [Christiangramia lutea]